MNLRKFLISLKSCKDQALADLSSLDQKMRVRLEWSDVDLMRSILLFLDTQSWQDCEENSADGRMSEIFVLHLKPRVLTSVPLLMRLRTLLSILGLTSGLDVTLTKTFGTSYKHHLTLLSGLMSYASVSSSSACPFQQLKLKDSFLF